MSLDLPVRQGEMNSTGSGIRDGELVRRAETKIMCWTTTCSSDWRK